jgi:hypothetical protein
MWMGIRLLKLSLIRLPLESVLKISLLQNLLQIFKNSSYVNFKFFKILKKFEKNY